MSTCKKCLLLLLVFVGIISTINCDSEEDKSHNWSAGTYNPKDRLLFRGVFHKTKNLVQKVVQDITYPDIAVEDYSAVITYIKAIDQYQDGNGGYVSLKAGGPGQRTATLHLKSKRFHGFNFIIEIYGHN